MILVECTGLLARKYSLSFKLNVSNWLEVVDAIDINHEGFKELYHRMELAGVQFYIIVEREGKVTYAGVATSVPLFDGDVIKLVPVFTPQFLSKWWKTIKSTASTIWSNIKGAWRWLTNKHDEGVDNNYRSDPNEGNRDTFSNSLSNRGPLDTAIPIVYGTMLVGSLELVRSTNNTLTPNRDQVEDDVLKGIHNNNIVVDTNVNYSELYAIGRERYNTLIQPLYGVYIYRYENEFNGLQELFDSVWTAVTKTQNNLLELGQASPTDPNSLYVTLKNRVQDFRTKYNAALSEYNWRKENEERERLENWTTPADRRGELWSTTPIKSYVIYC